MSPRRKSYAVAEAVMASDLDLDPIVVRFDDQPGRPPQVFDFGEFADFPHLYRHIAGAFNRHCDALRRITRTDQFRSSEVRLIPLKTSVEGRLNQILGDPDANLYLPLNPALPRHTATWYQRLNAATAAVDVAAMATLNIDLGLAIASQQNDKLLALHALLAELQAFPPGNAVSHTRIARTHRYNNLQVAINAAIAAPNVNAAQLTPLRQDVTALKNDRALLITAGKKIRSHQKGNFLGTFFNTVQEGGTVGTYNL